MSCIIENNMHCLCWNKFQLPILSVFTHSTWGIQKPWLFPNKSEFHYCRIHILKSYSSTWLWLHGFELVGVQQFCYKFCWGDNDFCEFIFLICDKIMTMAFPFTLVWLSLLLWSGDMEYHCSCKGRRIGGRVKRGINLES